MYAPGLSKKNKTLSGVFLDTLYNFERVSQKYSLSSWCSGVIICGVPLVLIKHDVF